LLNFLNVFTTLQTDTQKQGQAITTFQTDIQNQKQAITAFQTDTQKQLQAVTTLQRGIQKQGQGIIICPTDIREAKEAQDEVAALATEIADLKKSFEEDKTA
jgi:predicted RNase H-like nuclease (RuvC/YqgF family)